MWDLTNILVTDKIGLICTRSLCSKQGHTAEGCVVNGSLQNSRLEMCSTIEFEYCFFPSF